MDYDGFLDLVKKRRSIRRFKPDPVPDDYVDKIIEAARWAPSGCNLQPWEFIVVKKPELKDNIVKIYEEQIAVSYRIELTREPERRFPTLAKPPKRPPGFATAPVFVIMCGDPRFEQEGSGYPLDAILNLGKSAYYATLGCAFLYMHLAARALGLGAQWVHAVSYPLGQSLIKGLLGIPEQLEIYALFAVGYPLSEPAPRLVKTKEEMVHYDYYDKTKFKTDDQIKDFALRIRLG